MKKRSPEKLETRALRIVVDNPSVPQGRYIESVGRLSSLFLFFFPSHNLNVFVSVNEFLAFSLGHRTRLSASNATFCLRREIGCHIKYRGFKSFLFQNIAKTFSKDYWVEIVIVAIIPLALAGLRQLHPTLRFALRWLCNTPYPRRALGIFVVTAATLVCNNPEHLSTR